MAFAPTTPITGATQSGLTTPTYTIAADTAPDSTGKQYAVTALGGTQTGVTASSVSSPFTLTMFRPKNYKVLGTPNPMTGRIANVPVNTYQILTRKGVLPLAGQPAKTMRVRTYIDVPAGADLADPLSVRAALSAHIGLLSQVSSGVGDTVISGSI